jgi:hypothetical protein
MEVEHIGHMWERFGSIRAGDDVSSFSFRRLAIFCDVVNFRKDVSAGLKRLMIFIGKN